MEIYKFRRTTENLNFIINLFHKGRSLGEASTDNNLETISIPNSLKLKTEDRLNEIMSFDIDNPYVVGVNGVLSIKDNIIEYIIDGNIYTTNINTKETQVLYKFIVEEYVNRNYFYDENKLGVDGILKNIDEVTIDRGGLSIVDKFSKLKNAKTTDDLEQIGNGFYKIIDQTVK